MTAREKCAYVERVTANSSGTLEERSDAVRQMIVELELNPAQYVNLNAAGKAVARELRLQICREEGIVPNAHVRSNIKPDAPPKIVRMVRADGFVHLIGHKTMVNPKFLIVVR